jgi:hypothetical protein
MATTPEQVRHGLQLVATAASAELKTAAEQQEDPQTLRAILFAATPILAAEYGAAAAALGAEWYEDIRDTAAALGQVTRVFRPRLIIPAREEQIAATVAGLTADLRDAVDATIIDFEQAKQRILADVADSVEQEVATALRETVTTNVAADPDAAGWRRFARPGACKFCLMLAAKGAVYTERSARFAAHGAVMSGGRKGGNCMCIAGPAFGPHEEATPMQYVASRKKRTAKQKAALRDYLNENFPDAPG